MIAGMGKASTNFVNVTGFNIWRWGTGCATAVECAAEPAPAAEPASVAEPAWAEPTCTSGD
jgi:hypothetical protein